MTALSNERELTIALSRGGSLKRLASSTNRVVTWPELTDMLSNPLADDITMEQYLSLTTFAQSTRKNAPGAFVGGAFSDGRRNSDSIQFRSVVTLDIDSDCDMIWDDLQLLGEIPALSGLAYQVHTTRKHNSSAPRMRISIPLSRDVSPEEYVPVLCAVAEMVDPEMRAVSSESFVAVQVMFLPSVCCDSEFFCLVNEGSFLDPDPLLAKYPVDLPELWPSPAGKSAKPFARLKITHPEDKKAQAPIITAVHRAFSPREFIEQFLDHVYLPAGERYLPVGATGAASVRIYEDAFVQSDHGSDPARGQHNTFDLGRIHLFGDLDEDFDTCAISPVEWPSYRAMVEWALEHEEVRNALAEVEDEVREERISVFLDELPELDDDDEDETSEDDELLAELLGEPVSPAPKRKGADELIRRLRKLLARAENVEEIEATLTKVQAIPDDVFSESARSVLCADVQNAYERCGEKLTKASASKALRHRAPSALERAGSEAPDWAEGWTFVYGDNSFHHADSGRVLSKEGFDAFYMQSMGRRVGFTPAGHPIVQASTAALTNWDIPKAYGTRFHPDEDVMFLDEGVQFVNTYRKPVIPDDGYRGNRGVELLKRLLADLYPEERHQRLVLDFLAHMYRFPSKKLKYALLLKGANEEGKTLIYRLMRRVLGKNNCATVQTSQLKKEFNDFIEGKLLCCIEEIKLTGREGAEALNNLKAPITNEDVSIEGKGEKVRNIDNFCNWMAFTNFEDAVPIEDSDSRWLILFSRFKSNEETAAWKAELMKEDGGDYRSRLYDEIEARPWQFIRFFEKYEFSKEYNPTARAPLTVFKAIMNEDGRSEERAVLEELLADGSNPLISHDYVHTDALKDVFDDLGIGASFRGRGVAALFKSAGFMKCRRTMISILGEKIPVNGWTRNGDICDVEGKLTPTGVDEIRKLFMNSANSDLDDLDSNVVPIRK